MKIPQPFDHYSLRARLQPALFTLLPIALTVFAWTGAASPWMSALWTACGTTGATYFCAIAVRNRGKQIEPKLWASWGGPPSSKLLRHSGCANPVMRERWQKYLAKALNIRWPTAEEERANPAGADQVYEAATKVLIAKTRDTKKFSLLYKENVSYGFCRNLYAMRGIGIFVAVVGVVGSATAGTAHAIEHAPQVTAWVSTALNLVFLFGWVARVSADWVRIPANAYADRLFEAIETLSRTRTTKTETALV